MNKFTCILIIIVVYVAIFGIIFGIESCIATSDLPFWIKFILLK